MFIESYIYVCIKRPKNTEQTVNSEGTSLVRYVMPANIVGSCIKSEYCNVGPLSRAGPGAESPRDGSPPPSVLSLHAAAQCSEHCRFHHRHHGLDHIIDK